MLTGHPPFLNNNKNTMLKNLVTSPVPLPYYLSEDAKSLLNGLFKIRPEERLGYKGGASEIKKHKFFSGINWTALLQKKIKAPVNFADQLKFDSEEQYVNSNGFEKWNSWQMNMESPVAKKTKESREHFEGFTYENCEVEFYEDETPGQV
jgi:serine/threonine protein kinase